MTKNITVILDEILVANPEKVAMITGNGQEISYEQMRNFIYSFAENLWIAGVRPGDYIAPILNEFAVGFMMRVASIYIGANTFIGVRTDGVLERGVPLKWVVVEGEGASKKRGVIHFDRTWLRRPKTNVKPAKTFGVLAGSSGTTGKPKYMQNDHQSFSYRISREGLNRPINVGPTLIAYGQGAGVGFAHTIRSLATGSTIICTAPTGLESLERMKKYNAEFVMSPPQYLPILIDAAIENKVEIPTLKSIWAGGGSISRTFAKKCEDALSCEVYTTYGSSEAGGVAFGRAVQAEQEVGYVGKVGDLIDIKFVDENGADADPETGGEILIGVPKRNQIVKTFGFDLPYDEEGFYHPGDVGYMTEDGDLVISGRTKDIINCGGNKVAPTTIEAKCLEAGAIKEAVAFGFPNEVGSEDIGVAIVGEPDFDMEKLNKHIEHSFGARYNIHAFTVDKIPQTDVQKVDRAALRKMIS